MKRESLCYCWTVWLLDERCGDVDAVTSNISGLQNKNKKPFKFITRPNLECEFDPSEKHPGAFDSDVEFCFVSCSIEEIFLSFFLFSAKSSV